MVQAMQTVSSNEVKTQVLHMDSNLATVICGPIAVVVWRGVADSFGNLQVQTAGIQALKQNPAGIGVLGVVEDTHQVPNAEARKSSAQVNDRLAEFGAVGFAGVLPLKGFTGAWTRGVVTGLTLLARRRYQFQVFQYEEEATKWLAGLLAQRANIECDAAAVARAIRAFRREYADYCASPAAAAQG
jgi:hypothetical protein